MKRPKIEDYSGEDVSGYAAYNRVTGEYYEEALEQYCDDSDRIRKDQAGLIIRKQKQVDDLKKENEKLIKDFKALKVAFAESQNDISEYEKDNEKLRKILKHIQKYIYLGDNDVDEAISKALKQKS